MEFMMNTERPSPRYADIDLWDPTEILEGMIEAQFAAVSAVREARPELERAALAIAARIADEGRLVYAGLMVDLQAVNQKLSRRSEEILHRLSGRSAEEIRAALQKANGSVKLAALLLRGCDPERASALLERTRGNLRAALALIDRPGSDLA